jgi:hypothetical protein
MQVQLCIVAILPCAVAAFLVIDAAFSCNDPSFVVIGSPDCAALHPGYDALIVIPAKAGIQLFQRIRGELD